MGAIVRVSCEIGGAIVSSAVLKCWILLRLGHASDVYALYFSRTKNLKFQLEFRRNRGGTVPQNTVRSGR